jgi:hypothetical protein
MDETLTWADTLVFPVMGSVALLSLWLVIKYVGKEWLNAVLGVYCEFWGFSLFCFSLDGLEVLVSLGTQAHWAALRQWSSPIVSSFSQPGENEAQQSTSERAHETRDGRELTASHWRWDVCATRCESRQCQDRLRSCPSCLSMRPADSRHSAASFSNSAAS